MAHAESQVERKLLGLLKESSKQDANKEIKWEVNNGKAVSHFKAVPKDGLTWLRCMARAKSQFEMTFHEVPKKIVKTGSK